MQRPILKWTYNTTAWKVLRYLIKNKRIAVLNPKNRKDFYNRKKKIETQLILKKTIKSNFFQNLGNIKNNLDEWK